MAANDDRRSELLSTHAERLAAGPFTADWASLEHKTVPAWYEDAKFGIFIHWLVASVPAFNNEWYARNMYLEGTEEYEHHVATYGPHAQFGFKDFIPDFTGSRFDAEEWMSLIERSGAKYVVPVAEHHDGFAMYASGLTDWNATAMGPHRDVIGELAAAAKRHGITFGVSSHRAENWWFYNGGTRFDSDVTDPASSGLYGRVSAPGTEPDTAFLDDWLARLVELVEQYEPAVVWFDWWIETAAFEPYRRAFAAYLYNRIPESAINYKWEAFTPGSAVYDVERGAVRGIEQRFFQNDTSTSRRSWCHIDGNLFKTAADVVGELLDAVSKNGSLLLNIGPRPDGTIPDEEAAILTGVGDWLAVNGAAIYGSRPWVVYGEGPTRPAVGSFVDGEPTVWTSRDIRYTRSGDTVFAAFFTWPDSGVVLQSFASGLRLFEGDVMGVSLLGSDAALEWSIDETGLRVALPASRPTPISPVLRIDTVPPAEPPRHEPGFVE